ncbi:MAG: hypothetical protein CMJ83_07750 [Planctomycetes bacterium]|nr:hypothetical protein [Planctomycetota bacterium]
MKSPARCPVLECLTAGILAAPLAGLVDYASIAGRAEESPLRALPYAMAVGIFAAAALAGCAAALLLVGRAIPGRERRPFLGRLPLAAVAATTFVYLNRELFDGPAISQKSWVGTVSIAFWTLGALAALVAVLFIIPAILRARPVVLGASALLSAAAALVCAKANLDLFGAYPMLKDQLSLGTWLGLALALSAVRARGTSRPIVDIGFPALLLVASLVTAAVERKQDAIYRVRAHIIGAPFPLTSRILSPVETHGFSRLVEIDEVGPGSMESVLADADPTVVQEKLDRLVPGRRRFNILWIAVDALRADHLSTMGYPRPITPVIDEFARSAVLFERAITPTPSSAMAYSSTLNGIYSRACPAYEVENKVDLKIPDDYSLAHQMQKVGRKTIALTAFFHLTQAHPIFRTFRSGFQIFNPGKRQLELRAPEVTDQTLALLKNHRTLHGKTPFFMWAHYIDPHAPYDFHEEFDYGVKPADAYDGEIAYCDREIGRLLDGLGSMGLMQDTIIVLFGDHGEAFGEHNQTRHGGSLYQHQIHVPLIIRVPGLEPRRVREWVCLSDLASTMMSVLGVKDPYRRVSRDLSPLILGEGPWVDTAYADRPGPPSYEIPSKERTVLAGDLKLIWNPQQKVIRVYDLAKDKGETNNLFDPGSADQKRLLGLMRGWDQQIDTLWNQSAKVVEAVPETLSDAFGKLVDRVVAAADARAMGPPLAEMTKILDSKAVAWDQEARPILGEPSLVRIKAHLIRELPAMPADAPARDDAIRMLCYCGGRDLIPVFLEDAKRKTSRRPGARLVQFLARHGIESVYPQLKLLYDTASPIQKIHCGEALAGLGKDVARDVMIGALDLPRHAEVAAAVRGLLALGDELPLLRLLHCNEITWRKPLIIGAAIDGAIGDTSHLGTAGLVHIAHSARPLAAARARAELQRRLGDAYAREKAVNDVVFGAREASRYGRYPIVVKGFGQSTAADDPAIGPAWWYLAEAAWHGGDRAIFDHAVARLRSVAPGASRLHALADRVSRHFETPPKQQQLRLEVELESAMITAIRKGTYFLTFITVKNVGQTYIAGGDGRLAPQLGWSFVPADGGKTAPLISTRLPLEGLEPGETTRMAIYGQMAKKPGTYSPRLALVTRRKGTPLRYLLDLKEIKIP